MFRAAFVAVMASVLVLALAQGAGADPQPGAQDPASSSQWVPDMAGLPAQLMGQPQGQDPASQSGAGQVWQLPSAGSMKLDAVEMKDMDINDVFKMLSSRTGLNIIAGKSVQGRVTIFLKDVDVHDVLNIILKANGLAYEEQGNLIEVMPAADYAAKHGVQFGITTVTEVINLKYAKAEDVLRSVAPLLTKDVGHAEVDVQFNKVIVTDVAGKVEEIRKLVVLLDRRELETEVFDISYAKAEDLSKTVSTMLTKDTGRMEFDVRHNKLLVTDTRAKLDEMKKIVASLDKKDKEVIIEARIIQVTLRDSLKMGLDWEAILSNNGKDRVTTKNDFTLGAGVTPKSITTIGTLTSDKYRVALEMISSMGKTKLLSSPRIAVVNNQEAKIHIGSTQPYVTTSQTTPSAGPVTTAETVNFIDVGVKLNVTPTIHDDGYVTMKIRPEISSAIDKITTSEKNEIPIVETSEVDTTIRVKDGVTIIIGGLIKDETTSTKNKIPFLGDIPLVGRAFRSETQGLDKTEIVIFLTPHIISGDIHEDPDLYFTIKGNKNY